MAETKIAAVMRAGIFSPNHIGNDAAILHATAGELRRRGCKVTVYSEAEFLEKDIEEDVVVAMCRGNEAVEKLQRMETAGTTVVNSGFGIENCVRMIMTSLLKESGIPIPDSLVVDTNVESRKRLEKAGFGRCWVKRADSPTLHLEDSCRCRHPEEAQEILHEFYFRQIRKAVVSRYVEGEQIRFYGVASSGWFHSFIPYGPAEAEATEKNERIREIAMKAAKALGVDIFGGDMVMTPSGELYLVNFDDWPSFAPIRKEAARAIAKSVLARLKRVSGKRKRHAETI